MEYAFGEYLREVRLKRNLTLRQLSEDADVSYSQLGKIERGDTDPKPSTIRRIASALGIDPEDTLFRAGYMSTNDPIVMPILESGIQDGRLGRAQAAVRLYSVLAQNIKALQEDKSYQQIKEDVTYLVDHREFLGPDELRAAIGIGELLNQLDYYADKIAATRLRIVEE